VKLAGISRIKRWNIWKKINEPATNSKKNFRDLYRGIYEFNRDYQLQTNFVKDENGDLLADFRHFKHVEELLLSGIEYA
jgi:hypothetical protein